MPKHLIRAFVGALALAALGGCAGGVNQTQQEILAVLDGSRVNGIHIPNADCLNEVHMDPFPPVESVSGGGIEGVWVARVGSQCVTLLVRETNDGGPRQALGCSGRWERIEPHCGVGTLEQVAEGEYVLPLRWGNGGEFRFSFSEWSNNLLDAQYSVPKYQLFRETIYRRGPTAYPNPTTSAN